MKEVLIVGGGTSYPIKNHLSLSAPAYGSTARRLEKLCKDFFPDLRIVTALTKMADPSSDIETYDDLAEFTRTWAQNRTLKIVFYNPAVVDFIPKVPAEFERNTRLSSKHNYSIELKPLPKLIHIFRGTEHANRKDVFVVGFKQTYQSSEEAQYKAGLEMLKKNQINLVLANDTFSHVNMIITPEEASYSITKNRSEVLYNLVEMVKLRSLSE